ncbi:VCBS repeat-containing protein [Myxococcota bacterium]|nr:VCBS repeat-containing protein [Myxococcota bacterium]
MQSRQVIIALLCVFVCVLFTATGCSGEDGKAGSDGANGLPSLLTSTNEPPGANCPAGGYRVDSGVDDDGDGVLSTDEIDSTIYICHGTDGLTSLVTMTSEPAGANCAEGGQKVEVGLDDDGNGSLDSSEVESTAYMCQGSNGLTSLVSVTAEPAGSNCVSGGQKIMSGLDDDGNGVLEALEVVSTVYICHGTDGDPGATSLITVTPEPAGPNCVTTGRRVDIGVDDDSSGTLDATEIDQTSYVCDGADGLSTLVWVTPEPNGTNCPEGGQKVETGLDDNGDGTLDSEEVSTLVYLCHGEGGAEGTAGPTGLVSVTNEPAGTNCPAGGQKLETGLDTDVNGVLDPGEVESTVYVCDGEDGAPNSCTGYRIGEFLYLDCDDGTHVTWYVGIAASSGLFVDSGQSLGSYKSRSVSLGDLDGDGDLDAFVANEYQGNRVWLNDGSGNFTDSGQSLGSLQRWSVSLGDLDGDGDLDAFVANSAQGIRIWLNDGNGNFTDSGQNFGCVNCLSVKLGDLDGDGDLDAFEAGSNLGNRVYFNDGNGLFTDSGQSLGNYNGYSVSLGDLDGDGDLDAFVGNYDQGNRVWLNDGSGFFTDSGQSLGSSYSWSVGLGDLDGDGDLDAFVANSGQPNRVWLNDGTGVFTDSGQSLGGFDSFSVSLGDLDGDGDLDAFVANYGQGNRVWLNDGTGVFTDNGQILGNFNSFSVSLGDLDGDGDLDAYVASYNQGNRVWLNQ